MQWLDFSQKTERDLILVYSITGGEEHTSNLMQNVCQILRKRDTINAVLYPNIIFCIVLLSFVV